MNARLVALVVAAVVGAAVIAVLAPSTDDPFYGEFSRHSHLMEKR